MKPANVSVARDKVQGNAEVVPPESDEPIPETSLEGYFIFEEKVSGIF